MGCIIFSILFIDEVIGDCKREIKGCITGCFRKRQNKSLNAERAKKNKEKFEKNKEAFIKKEVKYMTKERLDAILEWIRRASERGETTLTECVGSITVSKYNATRELDKEYIISELQKRNFKVENVSNDKLIISF